MIAIRGTIIVITLFLLWELLILILKLPPYILPSPIIVLKTWYTECPLIIHEAIPTMTETFLGLFFGALFGIGSALMMNYLRPLRFWFLPILLISQALPTFAVAPLLVIWFGYGMTSKIITTIIMLFFPITNAFYDGLMATPQGWLDLANTTGASSWRTLIHIKIPAALPSLATGLRVATAIAPIGAIVSEWVGASKGLGFLMLNANARMQIDLMFAALLTTTIFTIALYFIVDKCLKWAIPW